MVTGSAIAHAALTLAAIASPSMCRAQIDNSYPHAADMRTLGEQQGRSAPSASFDPSLKCKRHDECLVVVNNNPEYLVSGFYINDDGSKEHDGSIKWSGNLFRSNFVLQLHRAWWVHRSTKLGCLILAKAEIREKAHRNHLWETDVQRFDMCRSNIPYTILYVNPLPADKPQATSAASTEGPH